MEDELASLASLDADQLLSRIRMLDNNMRVMNGELSILQHRVDRQSQKVRDNQARLEHHKELPHLVATVLEIIDLPIEDEQDSNQEDDSSHSLGPARPCKTAKRVVLKLSTGHTVLTPNAGLVDLSLLKPGQLVGVNRDSHMILQLLSHDSSACAMEVVDQPQDDFTEVGGLDAQIQELYEAVIRPITHPHLFKNLNIQSPRGVLLYGPPGTGKTLLARACANKMNGCFLRLGATQLVHAHIGEGAKLIRDVFALAKQKAPALIFIDELDAIGTKRFDSDQSGDREVQRTMLELLNQMDGFATGGVDHSERIKVIAATNRPDTLDPALLRSGRFDRKIELPLPDVTARIAILRIHSNKMLIQTQGLDVVNFEELAQSTPDFNAAMLKAVCTEAGMVALRRNGGTGSGANASASRITHEDFMSGIAEVQAKKRAVMDAIYC